MSKLYDVAIIGGGLGGLCAAVQLATKGFEVILFEKNTYPFHKVCGEYISMESWDFLHRLGLPLSDWNLPRINELGISSTKGFMLNAPLELGGFGVSRYTLDKALCELAREKGATIVEGCKVTQITSAETHLLQTTTAGSVQARLVLGAYGRTTPAFMPKINPPKLEYIGVKYHIKTNVVAANRIELHNFEGGYCGISKIEEEAFCLCYLTLAQNLKAANNDIPRMEAQFLRKNPYLNTIFEESTFIYAKPLTISNISFQAKSTVSKEVFTLGDAAGSIAPLCGNGMSMAMRASYFLSQAVSDFLEGKITKTQLEQRYASEWKQYFQRRIKAGFYIQYLFGNNLTTDLALKTLHHTPNVLQKLIKLTHGTPY